MTMNDTPMSSPTPTVVMYFMLRWFMEHRRGISPHTKAPRNMLRHRPRSFRRAMARARHEGGERAGLISQRSGDGLSARSLLSLLRSLLKCANWMDRV